MTIHFVKSIKSSPYCWFPSFELLSKSTDILLNPGFEEIYIQTFDKVSTWKKPCLTDYFLEQQEVFQKLFQPSTPLLSQHFQSFHIVVKELIILLVSLYEQTSNFRLQTILPPVALSPIVQPATQVLKSLTNLYKIMHKGPFIYHAIHAGSGGQPFYWTATATKWQGTKSYPPD